MYTIKINNEIIGTTNFEFGDPPMGTVFGNFIPDENYEKYEKKFDECWKKQNFKNEVIEIIENSTNEKVSYLFYSLSDSNFLEGFTGGREIILNINLDSESYKHFFSNHIDEYDKRFSV